MPKNSRKNSKKRSRVTKKAQQPKLLSKLTSLQAALVLGTILVIFGLFLAGFQLFNIWRAQQTTAAPQPIGTILNGSKGNDNSAYISDKPSRIVVPSVGINLPIIPGYYYQKSNSWTLTLDKAHWGTMSREPNDKSGMTFIYAHYRQGVFYKLPKIKPGELAKVVTENSYTFTYRFRANSIVPPQDTSIFSYHGDPILILQTCTGVRFENRQLFIFDLVKVEK